MKSRIFSLAAGMITASAAIAGVDDRPVLLVNTDVTTHIVMPEQLKMVDISTDIIAGDQCADNMLRIKPVLSDSIISAGLTPYQFLGTITLIGERHMTQYDVRYSDDPAKADALFKVKYDNCQNYSNPDIAMPEAEMANYAWAIVSSKRKFNSVRSSAYGISASINNIYSIDNYFFIDLNLKNNTNIQYDIAQLRVTLADKKETKATNSQTLELTPSYILNHDLSFKKNYRQVIVLPKLTFPEEKVLNIEISEDQISGRVLTIPVEYEDILHADAFDKTKLNAYDNVAAENKAMLKEIKRLTGVIREKQGLLDKANVKLDDLGQKLQKTKKQYLKIERKMRAMMELNRQIKRLDEHMAEIDKLDDIDIDMDSNNSQEVKNHLTFSEE